MTDDVDDADDAGDDSKYLEFVPGNGYQVLLYQVLYQVAGTPRKYSEYKVPQVTGRSTGTRYSRVPYRYSQLSTRGTE